MQGARNGPRTDEDPVAPRHTVAGGPAGYKHGTRDGKGGRHQEESLARAEQQPQENRKAQDAGCRP